MMDDDENDAELQAALALSLAPPSAPPPPPPAALDAPLQLDLYRDFYSLFWDPTLTTPNDRQRWIAQGIQFQADRPKDHDNAPYLIGLTQSQGGPCGVLAAIQAEILALLLFQEMQEAAANKDRLLAMALGRLIARSTCTPLASATHSSAAGSSTLVAKVAMPSTPGASAVGLFSSSSSHEVQVQKISATSDLDQSPSSRGKRLKQDTDEPGTKPLQALEDDLCRNIVKYLLSSDNDSGEENTNAPLESFRQPGGVMLLVLSLCLSRGPRELVQEMDDPEGSKLTAQFGHCSQELINLLLTGQAVSNVFDGTMPLGEGLECRGISHRPSIGYLTQLEALRYVQVGNFYKKPKYPIWVIGSTSHFSVLFLAPGSTLDDIEEKTSQSDQILEKCRQAFLKADPQAAEQGMIPVGQLATFLSSAGIVESDTNRISSLAALVQMAGTDMILWEDLWIRVSRLCMGASWESVLQTSLVASSSPSQATNSRSSQEEDDEALARKLHAELNPNVPFPETPSATSEISDIPDIVVDDGPSELQEAGTSSSTTLSLIHYNGLRGGVWTKFSLTIAASSLDVIGSSVPLIPEMPSTTSASRENSLIDILKTKWPSAVVRWNDGQSPPGID